MGHSGEGIRVTGRLEVVGGARGCKKLWRRETRGGGGPVGAAAPSDAARPALGDFPRWALGQFDMGLGRTVKGLARLTPFPNSNHFPKFK
jgi:hypothetical protein